MSLIGDMKHAFDALGDIQGFEQPEIDFDMDVLAKDDKAMKEVMGEGWGVTKDDLKVLKEMNPDWKLELQEMHDQESLDLTMAKGVDAGASLENGNLKFNMD